MVNQHISVLAYIIFTLNVYHLQQVLNVCRIQGKHQQKEHSVHKVENGYIPRRIRELN